MVRAMVAMVAVVAVVAMVAMVAMVRSVVAMMVVVCVYVSTVRIAPTNFNFKILEYFEISNATSVTNVNLYLQ